MSDRVIVASECKAYRIATDQHIKEMKENIKANTQEIAIIKQQTTAQDATLEGFKDAIKDLNTTVLRLAEILNRVDKETALNSNNIKWNWKTILAAGSVISFLTAIILSFITRFM